jgi:site-specific recombinase XerD
VFQKRKTQIREGKFFPESLHAHKVTVAEAIDEYLRKSEARLKHVRHYKRLGRYWKEELGVKPLASVTPGDVKSYIAKRVDRFSPASIKRQLAFLKKVFSDCVLDGVVETNPVKSVRMFTENNARTRSLSYEEENRLLAVLPERYRSGVLFALNSGLRQTEQFQLRRADVVAGSRESRNRSPARRDSSP